MYKLFSYSIYILSSLWHLPGYGHLRKDEWQLLSKLSSIGSSSFLLIFICRRFAKVIMISTYDHKHFYEVQDQIEKYQSEKLYCIHNPSNNLNLIAHSFPHIFCVEHFPGCECNDAISCFILSQWSKCKQLYVNSSIIIFREWV